MRRSRLRDRQESGEISVKAFGFGIKKNKLVKKKFSYVSAAICLRCGAPEQYWMFLQLNELAVI